ncbi:MAG: RagB/SusD family nutrient uptake outer membrane protein [Pedobacter sp.]|nr:MAG: RagB/SusD family nutrient uptake outer membrane protein [Pedobacter sp.]
MKTIKLPYIIALVLVLTSATSCKKILDTQPEDFLSSGNYFKTEAQLNNALTGIYEILSDSYMYSTYYISEMGTEADEGYYRVASKVSGPQVYLFGASDVIVTNFWQRLYQGIGRANILLANIERPTMDEAVREQFRGEALFLRSYYYFLLVTHFGDVPLVLTPTESAEGNAIPRTPSKDVYEQITNDLKTAENLVKSSTDLGYGGRVSRSAVRGMLARIYLHWAGFPLNDATKYQDAKTWAQKVMDPAEGHRLNPSYEDVFKNYSSDKYDVGESILEVEFWGNLSDAFHAVGRVGNANGIFTTNEDVVGFAYGYIRTTPKLYNLYEANDLRRDWAIAPFTYETNGMRLPRPVIAERNCGKFRREFEVVNPRHRLGTPINYPLLRYSDVLLMFAEAENKINGPTAAAHDALNLVRDRAKATLYTGANRISDQTAFTKVIQDERARELCFESLRKYDLIRWGIFVPEMKAVIPTLPANAFYALAFQSVTQRNVLFPIPTRELGLNRALTQNPGW